MDTVADHGPRPEEAHRVGVFGGPEARALHHHLHTSREFGGVVCDPQVVFVCPPANQLGDVPVRPSQHMPADPYGEAAVGGPVPGFHCLSERRAPEIDGIGPSRLNRIVVRAETPRITGDGVIEGLSASSPN